MYADRLVHLRKSRGLTQQEIADKLKISRSTYAQYELGRRRPDYETLLGLANIFNVSIDYLLGRTDDPQPPSSAQTPEKRSDSSPPSRPKDPYQQMIDEAIEQLEPEERRIIEKIRSMPDLDLQFKDFEADPVQNLRDLVKIWRLLHPEDFENGGVKK
ncbi:MAG: helix-turn-helix domain-containing protein [Hydrogenibacillus schlegelii]|uniref:Helix-turn-helix domain-containing protein n=1 Tax=Hydrogenibacillus schlegelii TaxID=1484 RepID=A0A947CWT5_HYDSH|nr:helix-turn-helix domain-containing protein [Hydrogenibacillus schlegelii]